MLLSSMHYVTHSISVILDVSVIERLSTGCGCGSMLPRYGGGFQEGASSIYNGSAIVAQAMERVGTNSLEGRFPLINTP